MTKDIIKLTENLRGENKNFLKQFHLEEEALELNILEESIIKKVNLWSANTSQ